MNFIPLVHGGDKIISYSIYPCLKKIQVPYGEWRNDRITPCLSSWHNTERHSPGHLCQMWQFKSHHWTHVPDQLLVTMSTWAPHPCSCIAAWSFLAAWTDCLLSYQPSFLCRVQGESLNVPSPPWPQPLLENIPTVISALTIFGGNFFSTWIW